MGMQILNLVQGSDKWKLIRGQFCVASEAPVIMGDSPNMKRDELLHLKSTGVEREVNDWVEKFIFKKGHEVEALARPIAEERQADEFFALTCTNEIAGLKLLASYDGITAPLYDIHWEHKQFNKELYELVKSGGELEGKHYWQLEHQLLVNGNDSCIFAVSDGTEENYADLEYHSRPERREQLIEGWKLFLTDLANYQPPEPSAPKAVAEPVASLPLINYQIDFSKGLAIKSNLELFKVAAQDLVEKSKVILITDQDFENAKARIRECEKAEKNIKSLIDRVLGELGDVYTFKADLESIGEYIKQSRLNQSKQVKTRSAERKAEIISGGKAAFQEHIATINEQLGSGIVMPQIPVDFEAAVFRKSSFENMQSGVNDALANLKIEANRIASKIDSNQALLLKTAGNHFFLFADIQQLVLKDSDAIEAIAKQRIAEHEAENLRRQQEEAQQKAATALAQESAAEAPTEQPERISETALAQASVVQQEPIQAATGRVNSRVAIGNRASRPGDDRIIQDLANLYQTNAATVIGWLRSMNLEAAEKRLAA